MYKKLLQFLAPFLLLVQACGAPTTNEVARLCKQHNVQPGETIQLDDTMYTCPIQPDPTPTPDTLQQRIRTVSINEAAALCRTNAPAWQHPDTAGWLTLNVAGTLETVEWRFENPVWIYTIGSRGTGFSWSYIPEYVTGYTYPGFGSLKVYPYEDKPFVVDETNADVYPQLRFTKLELTCP